VSVKPIYSITPFSLLDFKDYTSCIIWFAGCNMKCLYCYNPEIVNGKGVYSFDSVLSFLDKRIGLLDGVVFSGGECTLHKELIPFIMKVKDRGFKVKIDTNGLKPAVVDQLIDAQLIDYVALDFKSLPEDFQKITYSSAFNQFEKTFDLLNGSSVPFEIRTTIHSSLISSKVLTKMVKYLEHKKYKNEYFLQPYKNGVEVLTELPRSHISEEYQRVSSLSFPISWR
jgi:pyruvate formate lyase activating enzyme